MPTLPKIFRPVTQHILIFFHLALPYVRKLILPHAYIVLHFYYHVRLVLSDPPTH